MIIGSFGESVYNMLQGFRKSGPESMFRSWSEMDAGF